MKDSGQIFQTIFFQYSLFICQAIIVLSIILTIIRFIVGPHVQDRIVHFDMLYNLMMLFFISYAIKYPEGFYFDFALMVAFLGCVSSIALAKFLMRGEVIE